MDQQKRENDLGTLTQDARALMVATADVAGEKVSQARQRLSVALDNSRKIFGRVKEKAVDSAKATDEALREHPYQAIAIAIGVGTIIGYLVSRRCSCNRD